MSGGGSSVKIMSSCCRSYGETALDDGAHSREAQLNPFAREFVPRVCNDVREKRTQQVMSNLNPWAREFTMNRTLTTGGHIYQNTKCLNPRAA